MLIKAADDKQPQLDILDALLTRPGLEARTRKSIEEEIWGVRAGARAERDAAYEIEFQFGASRNTMTIHDLRIEVDGRVAQIDHLILNRMSDIWVCESKSFAGGVRINDHGEWSMYAGRKMIGIASPIEQNKRHLAVLKDVFAKGLVASPKHLGISYAPGFKSLILVSNSARIDRPAGTTAARMRGLDAVIKCEQLDRTIEDDVDQKSPAALLKLIGRETVETMARELVALHRPMSFDWAARFGLPPFARVDVNAAPRPTGSRPPCSSCGSWVSDKVIGFCEADAARFGGAIFCFDCQKKVPRVSHGAP